MGLLDDAIREHLELKRRRGADTADVARQEQEAFGAPRRGDFEGPPPDAQAVVQDEFEHEAPTTLHAVKDPPIAQTEAPRPHGDPADMLPHVEAAVEEHPVTEHRVVQQPAPPAPERETGGSVSEPEDASQRTRAFDADEVRAASGVAAPAQPDHPAPHEPGPEPPEPEPEPAPPAPRADEQDGSLEDPDVLEETPEFLQETPEHDRLWFEQRPPRDFDF